MRADGADTEIQGDRRALNGPATDGRGRKICQAILIGAAHPLADRRDHRDRDRRLLVNWLYRRSSKEVSFVRTGLLGESVVINGGAFVLPFIHDYHAGQHERAADGGRRAPGTTPSSPATACASTSRPTSMSACSRPARRFRIAAATLGRRTMEPEQLHALLVRQIRLGDPLGRLRDDHGGNARAARRLCRARQGRRAAEALAQNGLELEIGRDHRSRPDRPRILQPLEPLRRRRPDPADRGDRGPAQAAQRHRAGIR